MSKTLAKYRKRRAWPITVNGEEVQVRSPTGGEWTRSEAIVSDDKNAFLMGIISLEEDGTQLFPQHDGETDADFAKRVKAELSDVETEVIREVIQQMAKGANPPAIGAIVKN